MRTLVIGGGVAGLTAAFDLVRSGREVLLADPADLPGGVVRTHRAAGFVFEDGPNSIPGGATAFRSLVEDLGLAARVVPCRAAARRRFLVRGGRWIEVAPPPRLLFSPLLTWGETWRLLRERKIPARPADAPEESVHAFVARRFGEGLAMKYLDAIVAGVNGGDPRALGVEGAFPELIAMEREHGSVLGALAARRRAARAAGTPPAPAVVTLDDGLGALVDALARRVGAGLRLRTRVVALRRGVEGPGFEATLDGPGGRAIAAFDRVVLAAPPPVAAALLASVDEESSRALAAIPSVSLAVVQTGFRRSDLRGLPDGFGALVPRSEKLRMLGWIVPSAVFPGRAPADAVAISGFVGGAFDPTAVDLPDADLVGTSCAELAQTLRLPAPPTLTFARVVRWPRALPLALVGAAKRTRSVLDRLAVVAPDLRLVGGAIGGVGVPKVIAAARAAVLPWVASSSSSLSRPR